VASFNERVIVTLVISTVSLLACSKERNENNEAKILPSGFVLRSEAEAVDKFMELLVPDEPSLQDYVATNDIKARLYTYGEFNNLYAQEYGRTRNYSHPDDSIWLVTMEGFPPGFNNWEFVVRWKNCFIP
jgi:hypothetical protein